MSAPPTPTALPAITLSAGFLRRLASMFYESLLVTAVLIFGWIFPHILLAAFAQAKAPAWLIQAHLFLLLLLYFAWFWLHGGQTLAMKTWKIALVRTVDGGRPNWRHALLRLVLAALFYAPLLPAWTWVHYQPDLAWLGWLASAWAIVPVAWTLLDRDRQFLYDRLSGCALVMA